MAGKKIAKKLSTHGNVAGIIDSPASFKAALRLDSRAFDFFEIRVDCLAGNEEEVLRQLPRLKLPLILTVRHPLEGGGNSLSIAKRRASYEKFLPHATLVDIELRSAKSLADVILSAQRHNVGIILSYHNFHATPSLKKLKSLATAARKVGADVFKVAAVASTPAEVAALLSFQQSQKSPLSLMAMGKYGKISRLLFAQAGSVLNYGFIDQPRVSGQWPAVLLKQRIGELLS